MATFNGVEIYRSVENLSTRDRTWCNQNATLVYTGKSQSFTDSELLDNTTYYYKIFTVYINGSNTLYDSGYTTSNSTQQISETATILKNKLADFFVATSGKSIISSLALDGVDTSAMDSAEVASYVSTNYNVKYDNNIWVIENKSTNDIFELDVTLTQLETVNDALNNSEEDDLALMILSGDTEVYNERVLSSWMKSNVKILGKNFKIRRKRYDEFNEVYYQWVDANTADIAAAVPNYLYDLFLEWVNSYKAMLSNAQSGAADLNVHTETVVPTYQTWSGYSSSPCLTSDYPYQYILKKYNNTESFLIVSKSKIYYAGTADYPDVTSSTGVRWYKSAYGSAWSLINAQAPVFGYTGWAYSATEANYDVYINSALSLIYFSRTTPATSVIKYDPAAAIATSPTFDGGVLSPTVDPEAVTDIPVSTGDDGKPFVPTWLQKLTLTLDNIVTSENIGTPLNN